MTNDSESYGTNYPGLEAKINEKHAALSEEAKKRGKELGMDNLPNANDPAFEPYSGFIASGYKTLNTEVQQYLHPELHEKMRQSGITAYQEKKKELEERINSLTHINKIAAREIGITVPVPEQKKQPEWRRTILPIIFFTGEFLFTTKIFELQGDDLITSFGIAALLTICSYFLSKYAMTFLRQAKEEGMKKYLAAACCMLFGVALSFVLALWRAKVIAAGNPDAAMSPAEFAVLNLVIFVVSMLLTYRYLTQEENAAAQTHAQREDQAKHDDIRKRTEEIKRLTDELEALTAAHKQKLLHHEEMVSIAMHTRRRINALYLETMEAFRSAIISHRSDRQIPKCICHPVPDLFPDLHSY